MSDADLDSIRGKGKPTDTNRVHEMGWGSFQGGLQRLPERRKQSMSEDKNKEGDKKEEKSPTDKK